MMERIARAKINLALHVTGQRKDGYHLLDSLVTFAEIGDRLSFQAADSISLLESGAFSEQLINSAGDNLVLRASKVLGRYFEEQGQPAPAAAITLEKNLPIASGIGGGSADAAATLSALNAMAQYPAERAALSQIALSLGADVPMCLESLSARVTGVGEKVDPISLPSFPMVLANPGVQVPTVTVFSGLTEKQNPAMGVPPIDTDAAGWVDWLGNQRNDLQSPAQTIARVIGGCVSALKNTVECQLARMSGSGATCFGLYATQERADEAAAEISAAQPDWWVVSTRTVS
ncbi:MAG: 4-(cytidine 5'-diphospho)-2-C-methyl-D-erythritol kinase [Rhizobiaceae bacterium]